MTTAAELLSQIAAKEVDIETARATHLETLESELGALHETLKAQRAECSHSSVSKIDSPPGFIVFKCDDADCGREFECAD